MLNTVLTVLASVAFGACLGSFGYWLTYFRSTPLPCPKPEPARSEAELGE